jgi:hypothetical protein
MMGMPVHIGWHEIALRLVLTIIAGLLIGYTRTEHGLPSPQQRFEIPSGMSRDARKPALPSQDSRRLK